MASDKIQVSALAAAALLSACGAEFNIRDGVSDWDSASSYEENAKPGQDDVVVIPDGTRVTLNAADSASWALVGKLARIRPKTDASVLVVNVDSGNPTFPTIFTQREGSTVTSGKGKLVKTGDGSLTLGDYFREYGGSSGTLNYDYYATLVVSNGVLKLPQQLSNAFWVYRLEIARGATLVLGKSDTYPRAYVGEGTITTEFSSPYSKLMLSNNESERFDFAGVITGKVRLCPELAYMNLMGVDSDFNVSDGASIGRGCIGVMKFGCIADEASSIGAGHYHDANGKSVEIPFTVRNVGGTWRYLGTGETSDRRLTVWQSPAVLDGGAHGGLTLSGKIYGYDQGGGSTGTTAMMHQLVLCGSNETACVISGETPLWYALNNTKQGYTGEVTNYTFHVTKRGSGTWRFAAAKRHLAGAIAVEDGTLQFDSINETNRPSALGTASILREPYTGVWNPSKAFAPALTLGTASTTGALEFTGGDNDVSWTATRPIVLKGDGRILNSTARGLRLKGVTVAADAPGAKTLSLGGGGQGENELLDVSDTVESPVTVVKEGPGTWTLGGNQSVRGGIDVKSGTLRIRKPTDLYRYYKLTVRGIIGSFVDDKGTTRSSKRLNLRQIGLYDKDNMRIDFTPVRVSNVSCLCEGGVTYAENLAYAGDTWSFYDTWSGGRDVFYAFDSSADPTGEVKFWQTSFLRAGAESCPLESDPTTWVAAVWRLPESANPACGYDLAVRYSEYGNAEHTTKYSDGNGAGQPTSWALAASVDGLTWDELSSVSTNETAFATHNKWCFAWNKTVAKPETAVHPTPCAVSPRATVKPTVFADGVKASVAAGATLEVYGEGDDVTISGLTIRGDVGLGRVNGFCLAETGTIDFTDLPTDRQVSYPGALAGCKGLGNVASWSVTKGGQPTDKVSVAVREDGTVTVTRGGLVLIVR